MSGTVRQSRQKNLFPQYILSESDLSVVGNFCGKKRFVSFEYFVVKKSLRSLCKISSANCPLAIQKMTQKIYEFLRAKVFSFNELSQRAIFDIVKIIPA
jgi:hypothetical protein